jgi:hypothetical protein
MTSAATTYTYFRERSEALAVQSVTTPEAGLKRSETASGTVLTFSSISCELRQKVSFALAAAVASFFSVLEHLLVFALPSPTLIRRRMIWSGLSATTGQRSSVGFWIYRTPSISSAAGRRHCSR